MVASRAADESRLPLRSARRPWNDGAGQSGITAFRRSRLRNPLGKRGVSRRTVVPNDRERPARLRSLSGGRFASGQRDDARRRARHARNRRLDRRTRNAAGGKAPRVREPGLRRGHSSHGVRDCSADSASFRGVRRGGKRVDQNRATDAGHTTPQPPAFATTSRRAPQRNPTRPEGQVAGGCRCRCCFRARADRRSHRSSGDCRSLRVRFRRDRRRNEPALHMAGAGWVRVQASILTGIAGSVRPLGPPFRLRTRKARERERRGVRCSTSLGARRASCPRSAPGSGSANRSAAESSERSGSRCWQTPARGRLG